MRSSADKHNYKTRNRFILSIPVLICDDSGLARKQMARALPDDLDAEITFAGNGREGLAAIRAGQGRLVFLDLNMPEMDGYQVLEALAEEKLAVTVIVVSGDIQPEAMKRVQQLGALEFIRKPVDSELVRDLFAQHGLRDLPTIAQPPEQARNDFLDGYREVANVAMGRAADLLARLLNVFVVMPIPNVSIIEVTELRMALDAIAEDDTVSAVCQGFVGSGIAGEGLLIFTESSFTDMADLMRHTETIDQTAQIELVMDTASILIGACLKGIADQLDITFSQGHPIVLGQHVKVSDLIRRNATRWNKTLAIEMGYQIENRDIKCDLLILFTEDSIPKFDQLISYLMD
jgi:chemotaxis protein CheY-P-specific phosphatase CheC